MMDNGQHGVIHAGTGNQRKQTADQKSGNRCFADPRHDFTVHGKRKRSQKDREKIAEAG